MPSPVWISTLPPALDKRRSATGLGRDRRFFRSRAPTPRTVAETPRDSARVPRTTYGPDRDVRAPGSAPFARLRFAASATTPAAPRPARDRRRAMQPAVG